RGKQTLDRLTQLKGKRIAIGPEGSGTRVLALELLRANGIDERNARLLPLSGMEAVAALREGGVDVVFTVGPAQSSTVWAALYTPGVRIMDFAQAEAYVRRFPYLSAVTLPRGGVDLERDVPPHDVRLVATMATLVARESTHPALISLLLQAASEVHGQPGLFQRPGEFPNAQQVDFPLSPEADRYYKSGPSFLRRYLPFWAAVLVERLIVLLIPVIAVLFPLMRVLPVIYAWRVRARIYKWYGELKFLEAEIEENPAGASREDWLARLDDLEERVHNIPTPLMYTNQLYILREHIGLVRNRVLRIGAPS
ncbi:MAG: ABC transporter substrate-binding protein, partial [Burkholderiales bacterium]|nr:ABC transporter substrate-binding protein [Burkholderiales bacterium]